MRQFYKAARMIGLMCLVAICAISCHETKKKRAAASLNQNIPVEDFSLDSLIVSGEPYHLCKQELTSEEGIWRATDIGEDNYDYDLETTPIQETFFFPEKDIKNTEFVKDVQLRYNYANVLYRVLHSYELFCRKSSDDSLATRRDSIKVVAEDSPVIPASLLWRAIPEKRARGRAERMLNAYPSFDGNEYGESEFNLAYEKLHEGQNDLPEILNDSLLVDFEEHFWEWYDKRRYVPEYDQMAQLYLKSKGPQNDYTEEQIGHLKKVIEGEAEINRRTILALELLRLGEIQDATLFLGEILESGIYTKYLLEAWIAWRAGVQAGFVSPSSFSVIPNNYYDNLRVKCMNTLIRHIQTEPDKYDVCLLENLIYCEILHRMASLYGNESINTLAELSNEMFIQPSALGRDYLKEE